MKNFICLFAVALFLVQCTNENANNADTSAETPATETPAEPKHYAASPDAPLVGLWVVEFALGSPKSEAKKLSEEYQGRWFNLKPDNTFVSGKWQDTDNAGNWSYDANEKIVLLNFDKAEAIGHEWRIQGGGDRMVWVGNTPNNKKSTQLSLNQATELPQKK